MKKILIVEDDQLVANIYGNKFAREGFEVKIAPDGQAGLDLVHSFHPDVVVLDLMLPKMTGVELTRRIRAEPKHERLPVIVLSNAYLTSMMQQAWKAGATKCLSKTDCIPKQVVEAVRSVLSQDGTPVAATAPLAAAPAAAHKPSTPAQPAPASDPATSGDPDAHFQAELHDSFIKALPATLAALRRLLPGLVRSENELTRLNQIRELHRRIHALTSNACVAGVPLIARVSDPLEALLRELEQKPKHITASALRTVALAIDFLGILFEPGVASDTLDSPPPRVLVVDDEAISCRAVTYALQKAKLESVSVEDPSRAYDLLAEKSFDLIFLDVDMPSMSGYELCAKLRMLPEHQNTPVVFVTSLTDFESRTTSSMSGGNDFIAKPFLFIELAVRALVYVLRGRLHAAQ